MKTSFKITLLLFIGINLISCSKKRIEPKEEQLNSYSSINSYYDSKKQQEQEFIIDSTGSGPIIGNQGTMIWVSKENLMFPNGDSVQWPYTVKLIELYTPKDMVYYQMPNISNGSLLTTKAEVRIRAFKNGQELVLRPGCFWLVKVRDVSPVSGMKIYYGVQSSGYVDWTNNPAGDFLVTTNGYFGNIAVLGWVSCSMSASVSNVTTNYTFSSSIDDLQNVSKFIYFTNAKCLMQVYGSTSGSLPNGEPIKIIFIGINSSNQLYFYYNNTQVSNSNQINLSLSPISDSQLTALLDTL